MRHTTGTILLAILASLGAAETPAAPNPLVIDGLCKTHEGKLKPLLTERDFAGAALRIARYEAALVESYPRSTFRKGVFRSAKHHLEFTATGWRRAKGPKPAWTRPLIYDHIVTLEKKGAKLSTVRLGGISAMSHIGDTSSDGAIEKTAMTVVPQIGNLGGTQWGKYGSHRVLVVEIQSEDGKEITLAMFVPMGKRLIMFALHMRGLDEDLIREFAGIVGASRGDHLPPDEARIRSLRAGKAGETADVVLARTRALAKAGEFHAAAKDLAGLRARLAASIPGPTMRSGAGVYSAYGIELTNPDAARYRLSAEKEDTFSALSVKSLKGNAQIYVMVLNLAANYGPKVVSILPDDATDLRKLTIRGACQGAVTNTGGQVRSQRARVIGRNQAYEVVADLQGGKARIKGVAILRGHLGILILGVAPTAEVADTDRTVEAMLATHLKL